MADIRPVTPEFAVAPQLEPADMKQAAERGYRLVINNRPDGEAEGQPGDAEMRAAAEVVGLAYAHIPVRGGPTPAQVQAMGQAIADAQGPVLAYCRSGTRSIITWSLWQAGDQVRPRSELVALGRNAGYDLSGVLG
jgi:uncharacterized protein (TIGR01244 family)